MKIKATAGFLVLFFGLPQVAIGGEWHVDSFLICADCHLQHASEDGQPLPGGPFSELLLKETVNDLCLMCHDGSDPTAPDVQDPVQMYTGAPLEESAAGFFALVGLANANGHDLGVSSPIPLETEGQYLELNCGHCHAVHGNGNYRNLLYDPAGSGDSILLVDGIDVFTQYPPDKPPTIAGSVAAYNRANVAYKQGYAVWCTSCHDRLSINSYAALPAHFNAHPSDVALNAFTDADHTDPLHWIAGTGEGFADTVSGGGIARVPFESPLSTDYLSAHQPLESDEVTCMSCHKAHGGTNQKGLLWTYMEGGEKFIAGCQQCHNK
ncbi:MAG: cytochrome c3 family protein [Candidatus Zixiibacteriota bacterium]